MPPAPLRFYKVEYQLIADLESIIVLPRQSNVFRPTIKTTNLAQEVYYYTR